MRHLFNGIGGFGLAAHWMGWVNVMHCEIDPFCNRVMNYHFPNSYQHEDIRTTDFTIWRGRIDLITGGDPCQPSSVAGKRKGKEDERYLWPEYYRAVKEIRPRWIVNENVPGTVSNGILDQKISDLEDAGYSWWAPFIIPASAVGAPHKRDRVWLVAYAKSIRKREQTNETNAISKGGQTLATNSNGPGLRSGFNPAKKAMNGRMNHSRGVNLHEHIQRRIGLNFQLNPPYVLEMMGFPLGWTVSPFLNGAENQ